MITDCEPMELSRSGVNRRNPGAPPIQREATPVILQKVNEIENALAQLLAQNSRISQAVARLVEPSPQDRCGEACAPTPQPSTIEGRLHQICRALGDLAHDLAENATLLDGAI